MEGGTTVDDSRIARDHLLVWDVTAPKELVDRLYREDVIDHNPYPGQGPGREGIREVIGLHHAVFPDLHLTCEDIIASGDRVAVRWSATGTHEGELLGVPPTHRTVRLTGIDILRLDDGMVAERWAETNTASMMAQLTVS
jgi:predicted ester cyclase